MNNQELLEAIAPYLPYGLKWSLQDLKTFTMSGITKETLFTEEGAVLNWNVPADLPQALFPILRPLSDLTKPCLENGKVPIVELAKICECTEIEVIEIKSKPDLFGVCYFDADGIKCVFAYDSKSNCFGLYEYNTQEFHVVKNQSIIFKWLYRHHFDINSLIPKYAIDFNTIKQE